MVIDQLMKARFFCSESSRDGSAIATQVLCDHIGGALPQWKLQQNQLLDLVRERRRIHCFGVNQFLRIACHHGVGTGVGLVQV